MLGLKEEGLSITRKTISEPHFNFWIKNEDKPPQTFTQLIPPRISILYEWGRFDDAEYYKTQECPYDIDKIVVGYTWQVVHKTT